MPQNRAPLAKRAELAIARALFSLPPRMQIMLSGGAPITRDGAVLHPQMQLLLALSRQIDAVTTLSHDSVATARKNMHYNTARFPFAGPEVGSVRDLEIPTQTGSLPARHYAPLLDRSASAPLLVYYHGGGFVLGSLDTHDHLCRSLCQGANVHVLSVEYRKAPEFPFPAGPEDALTAFRYAQAHASSLGADAARVAVGGDSAGANLSTYVARRTRADRPPHAQILIYPVTNRDQNTRSRLLFERGFFLTRADIDWFDRQYVGAHGSDDPDVSPLLDPDLRGLCPAVVVTAEFDPLRDEGEAYARALTAAGNSVDYWNEPGLMHGYVHSAAVASASRHALDRLIARSSRLLNR